MSVSRDFIDSNSPEVPDCGTDLPECPPTRRAPAGTTGRAAPIGGVWRGNVSIRFPERHESGPMPIQRGPTALHRGNDGASSFLSGIYFVFTRIVNHCLTLWASSRRTLAPTGRRNSGSARRIWLKLMRGDNQSLAKKTVWGNILWRFAGPGPGCSCKPAPQFVNQPLVTLPRVGLSPSVVSPSVVSPGIVMGRPYGVPTSCPKRRGKGQCAYC